MLIIAALACNMPAISWSARPPKPSTPTVIEWSENTPAVEPTPLQAPLPPRLVDTQPLAGDELALNQPITLYFNQAMNQASVAAALQIEPIQDKLLAWPDAATLVITPTKSLAPNSRLDIQIDQSAQSSQGLALTQPIRLNFQTAGYLSLTQHVPATGSQDVPPTAAIVAVFNRPVAASNDQQTGRKPAFELEPAANGVGKWVNASIYVFYPDPPLQGGIPYRVKLAADLRSLDGSPLSESTLPQGANAWTFTTAIPRPVAIEPANEAQGVYLDTELVLTFNQPMNPSSVEENFSLANSDDQPVPGRITWNHENTALTFIPEGLLARNTRYHVRVKGLAKGKNSTPLGQAIEASFQTVPNFKIIKTQPAAGVRIDPNADVMIYLSAPLRERQFLTGKSLPEWITITPNVTDPKAEWIEEQQAIKITGDFLPNQSYTLQISSELIDLWGGVLGESTAGQNFSLSFSTNWLPQSLEIPSATRVIFLSGQEAALPAQATNLDSIPLSIGAIPLHNFISLFGPGDASLRLSYRPDDMRSWTQTVELPENLNQAVDIYLNIDRQLNPPGLYWLKFNLPEGVTSQLPYLIVVSNIHLTYKISPTNALVWAVDLRTRASIPNAPITLYSEEGKTLGTGATNSDGIFQVNLEQPINPDITTYAVLGQPGQDLFGLAVSTWSQGIAEQEERAPTRQASPHLKGYLYADRTIYRPGESIHFKGVLRNVTHGHYTMPDLANIVLSIYDPTNQEMGSLELPISAFGTVQGQFSLPVEARPGLYLIKSTALPYDSLTIAVVDYHQPEINLQVSLSTERALAGQTLIAHVAGRYFYDVPAGSLPIHWELSKCSIAYALPGYQVGYLEANQVEVGANNFSKKIANSSNACSVVTQGDSAIQPDGNLTLEIPTQGKETSRQRYRLTVSAKDENGWPISDYVEIEVNPARFYIGVRPDRWMGSVSEQASFEVQLADWNLAPIGEQFLRAEYYHLAAQATQVASTDFMTSSNGQARIAFTPAEPGLYRIDVYGLQPENLPAHTQLLYWVDGAGQVQWPASLSQKAGINNLPLFADQASYQPGEQAQIFITNPFATPALGLISIEQGILVDYKILAINSNGARYTLPITENEAPNCVISVIIIGTNAQGGPDFRQGNLNLQVAPVEKLLKLEISDQASGDETDQNLTLGIRVSDQAGRPVEAELSVAVIDPETLMIAQERAISIPTGIETTFYGNQPAGVRTAVALAAHGQTENRPVSTGGGESEFYPLLTRQAFPGTIFWQANLRTAADGSAQLSFALPDATVNWLIDLRGLSKDTRVGQRLMYLNELLPPAALAIRPATPHFLTAGDHGQFTALLQNRSASKVSAEVSLQADGIELDPTFTTAQIVVIAAHATTRLEWWGTVQDAEAADLLFSAKYKDATTGEEVEVQAQPPQGKLPIRRFTAPLAYAAQGVLAEPGQWQEQINFTYPSFMATKESLLHIELFPSLAAIITNALTSSPARLPNPPLPAGVEPFVSYFLPRLAANQVFNQLGLQTPRLLGQLESSLAANLQSLAAVQNPDGGWGWQPGSSSDPYLSAYVLLGFGHAQSAGLKIRGEVFPQARAYLKSQQVAPETVKDSRQLANLAWIALALNESGEKDFAYPLALYTQREHLEAWGKALLTLALSPSTPEPTPSERNQVTQNLIATLQATALQTEAGVTWNNQGNDRDGMHSRLTSQAMIVYALAQLEPGSPLLAEATAYLFRQRHADGNWGSTYDNAWVMLAMTEVLKGTGATGGKFDFQALFNGSPVAGEQHRAPDEQDTPARAEIALANVDLKTLNILTVQRGAGTGRLYYSVRLEPRVFASQAKALARGLYLRRDYYSVEQPCEAGLCAPLQSTRVGQHVTVHLTLTAPRDLHQVVVDDFIPAGAHILDKPLSSAMLGENPPDDVQNPLASGWGSQYFHKAQIGDDRIAWTADYLPAGTYELVYTLVMTRPGDYNAQPAHACQVYFPDIMAYSAGIKLEIKP